MANSFGLYALKRGAGRFKVQGVGLLGFEVEVYGAVCGRGA